LIPGQIYRRRLLTIAGKFNTYVINAGGHTFLQIFIIDHIDTGSNFATSGNDAGGNLPPVFAVRRPTTPMANIIKHNHIGYTLNLNETAT
jgi:hypothetical protein